MTTGSVTTAVSPFVLTDGCAAVFAEGRSEGGLETAFAISSFTEVGLAATANSVSGGFGFATSESTGFEGGCDSAIVGGLIAGAELVRRGSTVEAPGLATFVELYLDGKEV